MEGRLSRLASAPPAGQSSRSIQPRGHCHLAWEVDTLAELARIRDALLSAGALVGATDHATSKSLYGEDPGGIEFEVHWLVPADLITPDVAAEATLARRPLDLDREAKRYGAHTRGGAGVSSPASG